MKLTIAVVALLLAFFAINIVDSVPSIPYDYEEDTRIVDVTNEEYEYVKANLGNLENLLQNSKNRSNHGVLHILKRTFKHLFRKATRVYQYTARNVVCYVGSYMIQKLIDKRRSGTSKEEFGQFIKNICIVLKIEPEPVCVKTIDLHIDIILYVIDNTPDIDGQLGAAVALQSFGCESPNLQDWTIDLPPLPDNINSIENESSLNKTKSFAKSDSFNVVQITDIHYDPNYLTGSVANCDEPMCCRADSGLAPNPENAAGHWGDYRSCDTSIDAVRDAFNQVKKQHEFDYIYFTGDIISHKVWDTSVETNGEHIKKIMDELHEAFQVPVYPILGNHEPQPVNVFVPKDVSPTFVSTEWMMKLAAELWSKWLPADAKETILKGGYYTVSPKPGFRIIALNSNVCYTYNWWLLHESYDTYGQLEWLVKTLTEAEKNREAVHILSHVPTGDDTCFKIWSKNMRNIIRRFSTTITAIFNGHTHVDQFLVYFDEHNDKSIAIAYNGGSLTAYSYNNPNYRVYNVDSTTYSVLDYEQWIYNITEANLFPKENPKWFQLYSFKDAYKMSDLKPSSFKDLLYRMTESDELMQQYYRYKSRECDVALKEKCNEKCMRNDLCAIAVTTYGDNVKCEELLSEWDRKH